MVDAFKGLDSTSTRAYAARHRGELACAAVVRYDGGNCYPWGLAATRAARGSMVAIELMRTILRDALAAGCETETGEVTRAGETLGRYPRQAADRPLRHLGAARLIRIPEGGRADC